MDTEESNEYIFFRLFFSLSLAGNMSPEVWKGEEGRGARGDRSRRRGTEGRRAGFIKGQQRGKVNISQELEVVIFSRRFQIRSPTQKVLRTVITYWQALSAGCGTCVLSVIVIFFLFPPFFFYFPFLFFERPYTCSLISPVTGSDFARPIRVHDLMQIHTSFEIIPTRARKR